MRSSPPHLRASDAQTSRQLVSQAGQLFQSGRLADAAALLKPLVKRHSRDALATHLLGLCEFQLGALSRGRAHLENALSLAPEQINFYINYATLLLQAGVHADGLSICSAGLRRAPGHLQLVYLRATLHAALGQSDLALADFDVLLSRDPQNQIWMMERAVCLAQLGRAPEAIAILSRAAQADPADFAAPYNLSKVLLSQRSFDDALHAIEDSLSRAPHNAMVHSQHALILAEMGELRLALAAHDRAISLDPHSADALCNRAVLLTDLGRFEEALRDQDAALALTPHAPDIQSNRANVLASLGQHDASLRAYDQVLQLDPKNVPACFNRALQRLALGRFAEGWKDYDSRLDIAELDAQGLGARKDYLSRALRYGQMKDVAGKSIVLMDEQGVGDTIMFATIVPDLMACAKSLRLIVDARLVGLMQASFPGLACSSITTFLQAPDLRDEDVLLLTGSLGPIFRKRREDFSGQAYLSPDPQKVAAWSQRLDAHSPRRKIGLSWKGGTLKTRAALRQLELADFAVLLTDDFDFVNLQFGSTAEEISRFEQLTGRSLIDFPTAETHDLHDLAALIQSLDGVLTMQNTNVHLCGALGKTCLAIIPHVAEWRYGTSGNSMAWYDSVRLIRREAGQSKDVLMDELRRQLTTILGE